MVATIQVVDATGATQTVNTLPPLGNTTSSASLPATIASDDAILGANNASAPASDTASSSINGRLQRIAQRITSLMALLPAALGQTTKAGSLSVALASDQATATPIPSTSAENNHVWKASAGNLCSGDVLVGSTAGSLMLFDATSAPADGAVTPKKCWGPIPANQPFSFSFPTPLAFATGITAVFSSTGPFTKTAVNAAFLSGDVQ